MIKREFTFAAIPGLEATLNKVGPILQNISEALFKEWSKDKMAMPENVRRELFSYLKGQ